METHHTFIVNQERFLELVAYGSKDLKLPKSKEILRLRQIFSDKTLNQKFNHKSPSENYDKVGAIDTSITFNPFKDKMNK